MSLPLLNFTITIAIFCSSIEKNGWTPLAVAAANGQERIVDFFLKSGADIHRELLLNKEEGWKVCIVYVFYQINIVLDPCQGVQIYTLL